MAEESRAYMAVTRAAAGAGDNLIEFQFECRKVVFEDQDA